MSWPLITRILLLIFAYVVSGRLSLLLAIPPGFTTAIFLPMGIAMGATIIWGRWMLVGVFLGSSLLNLLMATAQGFSVTALSVACEIALGSTLAAALGAYLVKRVITFPTALADERDIFWFLFLTGPVATLVSASLGPLALYSNGIIAADYIAYSAWTWWVGDCIGILLATPLMFVFFARPRSVWASRINSVGLPVLLSSMLVVLVFFRSAEQDQNTLINAFHQQARLMTANLKNTLENSREALQGLRALFMSSSEIDRADFERYVNNINIQKLGISAISWNPRVGADERENFEQRLHAQGYDEFAIRQAGASGHLEVALPQEYYVVVDYIEPWELNRGAMGLNVAADPIRRQALEQATASGKAVMTAPLTLVQESGSSQSVLIFLPVWPLDVTQEPVQGFVTAIIRAKDLVANALTNYDASSYFIELLDKPKNQRDIPLFSNLPAALSDQQQALQWVENLEFAGRNLQIRLLPSAHFVARHTGQHSWYVLAGGLLFTSLLGAFLLLISGKTETIKNEVNERTKEISAILTHAFEAILIVDAKGLIVRANPAAARLFGLGLDQLEYLAVYHLIPSLHERFVPVLSSLESVPVMDTHGQGGNGETLELELSISHLLLGGADMFTLIIHDISERAKVDKMKREFISTVSHELRTPLTSIKGSLGICLSGATGSVSDSTKKMLEIASTNADRLVRLINDILDIDKLEFGQLEFKFQTCNLARLLEQSLEQCRAFAQKYQVQLVLDLDQPGVKLLSATLDTDRFLQVMFNLLSNAIKYSRTHGLVKVSLVDDENYMQIKVRDWGEGIPNEFRARIFQKFAQADSSDKRRRDGTGLGLSITKVIVERLGGSISFESEEGQGSEFCVRLPKPG